MTHQEKLAVARLLKAISNDEIAKKALEQALGSGEPVPEALVVAQKAARAENYTARMAVAELVSGYEIS